MQIINRIDQLIVKLNELKPGLVDDPLGNEEKFNGLLKSAMDSNFISAEKLSTTELTSKTKNSDEVPNWVNSDYYYNPENPRKPNMRELMEAMSGKTLESLYADGEENWKEVSSIASEILYGVIGSNEDTRDWTKIMESENILKAAQEHTATMYEPKVDIVSLFIDENIPKKQIAVIKDKDGNILRSLSDNLVKTEETLNNFGVKKSSIPEDIEAKVEVSKFNKELLSFLKDFDQDQSPIEQIAFQSATEVISRKLSAEIPLEEFTKL